MKLEVGSVLDGKVTGITKFGAFVELPGKMTGMVHISEVASAFVKDINDYLKEGQEVKVKVIDVSENGKVNLSIKKAAASESGGENAKPAFNKAQKRPARRPDTYKGSRPGGSNEPLSFEEMMNRFKQSSDEKMSDLKRSIDGKRGSYSRRGSRSPK